MALHACSSGNETYHIHFSMLPIHLVPPVGPSEGSVPVVRRLAAAVSRSGRQTAALGSPGQRALRIRLRERRVRAVHAVRDAVGTVHRPRPHARARPETQYVTSVPATL